MAPLAQQLNTQRFSIGHGTHEGRTGKNNEDSYGLFEAQYTAGGRPDSHRPVYVALVADGIGGSASGEVASRLAVQTITEHFQQKPVSDIHAQLEESIVAANRAIFVKAQETPTMRGMGTTIVAAAILDDQLHLAHAGDSRAYLIRDGEIYLLTLDHTWAQEAIDAEYLTLEQARRHPNRNVIKRFLGPQDHVNVDHDILDVENRSGDVRLPSNRQLVQNRRLPLRRDDVVLLCSDGLTDELSDAEILETVRKHNPAEAAAELIQMANQAGGRDNITVVILRKEEAPASPPVAAAAPSSVLNRRTTSAPTVPLQRQPGNGAAGAPARQRASSARNTAGIVITVLAVVALLVGGVWAFSLVSGQEGIFGLGGSAPDMAVTPAPAASNAPPAGERVGGGVPATTPTADDEVQNTPPAAPALNESGQADEENGTEAQSNAEAGAPAEPVDLATGETSAASDMEIETPSNAGNTEDGGADANGAGGEESGGEDGGSLTSDDATGAALATGETGTSTPTGTPSPARTPIPTVAPTRDAAAVEDTETPDTEEANLQDDPETMPTLRPTVTAILRPTPTPSPSPTPTTTRTRTPTPAAPTVTPTPSGTTTVAETPASEPADTEPAVAPGTVTGESPGECPTSPGAVDLVRPGQGDTLNPQSYEFSWTTSYYPPPELAFELVFWPHSTGVDGWRDNGRAPVGLGPDAPGDNGMWTRQVNLLSADNSSVLRSAGEHYWGVLLARREPAYFRCALLSEARRFIYQHTTRNGTDF